MEECDWMTVRIPWDKYEAVILLEAWLQVKSGVPRLQMVNLVSYQLRLKAVNQGREIDDVFRNTNGISFQLMSIATAYEQKNMGKAASKLFSEIADLYRTDYNAYQDIKKEAMKMVEYTSKSKNDFIDYVYKNYTDNVPDILNAVDAMEKFALSTKALTQSIYDDLTLDVISVLRKKVIKHKFFMVRYKKILPFAEVGLQFLEDYVNFLSASYNADDSIETTDANTFNKNESHYIQTNKDNFYSWLLAQGITDSTAKQYVKAVQYAEKFAEEHNFSSTVLYTNDVDLVRATVSELNNSPEFRRYNNEKHHRFTAAIGKLLQYCRIDSDALLASSKNSELPVKKDYADATIDFVEWMVENAELRLATAKSYKSAINTCDRYAHKNNLYSGSIVSCTTYDEFSALYLLLMGDSGFRNMSEERHNYLVVALNKYRDYMLDMANGSITKTHEIQTATVSDDIRQKYTSILMQEFEDGYCIGDYMHRMRFHSAYEERYNEKLEKSVDETEDVLRNIGQVREGRIFYTDKSDSSVLTKLYGDVKNAFDNGATAVYYECLYDKYSEQLANEMSIYSADTLRAAIQGDADFPKEYRVMKSYIIKIGVEVDFNEEIRKVLQSYHVPVTFEEIQSKVKHIPLYKVKQALVQIPDAAYIDEGTYFFAPNFYISTEEKIALIHAIRLIISTKGFLVAKDLRDVFRNTCPSSAMDSDQYKDHSIRNILKILLRDEFEFSSSTITEKGKMLDYGQIFQNYAADRERVTLNELLELKKELGLSVIYWDNIFNEMIRISSTEMVRKGTVEFDVNAVDHVLEEMYPDEYTPLKDVTLFLNLPPASVRWNGFLLESFLREYSKKFRLVQLSIAQDDYFGVMLKSSSTLENYADVAADMLARNHSWSDEKSALQLLKGMNFQQRAKNSNISTIIKAAKQKRLNID